MGLFIVQSLEDHVSVCLWALLFLSFQADSSCYCYITNHLNTGGIRQQLFNYTEILWVKTVEGA